MSATDFEAWAAPPLELKLHGRIYVIQPPTVDAARKLLAAAVRGEVNLGLVEGPVPAEVEAILDTIEEGEHPALGPVWQQMVDDRIPTATIDRTAYYATFFWARGKQYADSLGKLLWTPREATEGTGGVAPKDSSRPKIGRRTASASRTKTAGTPTTGRSRTT